MKKNIARARRSLKTKAIIRKSDFPRLVVFRSLSHIYAQIIKSDVKGDIVLVASSTKDKRLKSSLEGSKVDQAKQVGKFLAERAKDVDISKIAFDRAGYKYHGRVKALAEGAREGGLEF